MTGNINIITKRERKIIDLYYMITIRFIIWLTTEGTYKPYCQLKNVYNSALQ